MLQGKGTLEVAGGDDTVDLKSGTLAAGFENVSLAGKGKIDQSGGSNTVKDTFTVGMKGTAWPYSA